MQLSRIVSILKKSQPRWVGSSDLPPKSTKPSPSSETPSPSPSFPPNFPANRSNSFRKETPSNSPAPYLPPKSPIRNPSPRIDTRSPSVSPPFPRKSPPPPPFLPSSSGRPRIAEQEKRDSRAGLTETQSSLTKPAFLVKPSKPPALPSSSPPKIRFPTKSISSPSTPVFSPTKSNLPTKPFSSPATPVLSPARSTLPKPPPPSMSTLPPKPNTSAKPAPPLPPPLQSRFFAIDHVVPDDLLCDMRKEPQDKYESIDVSDSSQEERIYPHGSTIVNHNTVKRPMVEESQMTIKDIDDLAGTIRLSELEATMELSEEEVRVSDVLRESFMDELLEEAMKSVVP